jgi:NAD(P)H dehydrogenase (quinone)
MSPYKSCKIAIIYYTRSQNIKTLADQIAAGARASGAEVVLMTCQEAENQLSLLEKMDGIVFGSPTYFGSVAGEMKLFFEKLVEVWYNKKWQNKIAAAFTHSSSPSGDKLMTLMEIMIFAMQNGMIWVGPTLLPKEEIIPEGAIAPLITNQLGSWLGLMATSDSRRNLLLSEGDLLTAKLFGERIALVILARQS